MERHFLANGTKPEVREAIAWTGETQTTIVDLKFCDLLGTWQLNRSGATSPHEGTAPGWRARKACPGVLRRRAARLRP